MSEIRSSIGGAPVRSQSLVLPKIGDTVTPEQGAMLAEHYGLHEVAARVRANPEQFQSFVFDGVSALPDRLLEHLLPCWDEVVYQAALPHDLAYAYGKHGDEAAKKNADQKLFVDLVSKAGTSVAVAAAFYGAVRLGGVEKLHQSFSWAYARVV